MPLLAGLIQALFVGLAGWLGQWMAKKTAFATAAVAAFGVLTVGLFTGLSVIVQSLAINLPAGTVWSAGLWITVPDNGPAVVAATLSCDAALALYRWNVENLRLAAWVT